MYAHLLLSGAEDETRTRDPRLGKAMLYHWATSAWISLVEEGGFEPPKHKVTDLQSVPFGHSGTPPWSFIKKDLELVGGLEPLTYWLQVSCSTNWATPAYLATRNGLEPSTSSVTGWHSNQLNYRAKLNFKSNNVITTVQSYAIHSQQFYSNITFTKCQ